LVKGGEVWEAKDLFFSKKHALDAGPKPTEHWLVLPISAVVALAGSGVAPVCPVTSWRAPDA
jgi:hypothetical protein